MRRLSKIIAETGVVAGGVYGTFCVVREHINYVSENISGLYEHLGDVGTGAVALGGLVAVLATGVSLTILATRAVHKMYWPRERK